MESNTLANETAFKRCQIFDNILLLFHSIPKLNEFISPFCESKKLIIFYQVRIGYADYGNRSKVKCMKLCVEKLPKLILLFNMISKWAE